MNVLSLFSGIGGIDLGLQRAGMTIAGQVELDPWCRKILAKHWPEVPRHDDVRTAAAWWGGRAVDLVAGGFPCQPVSLAGKGLAQADSRWLWPATRDVVRDLRPCWVLLENVPGLLGRGMGDVLGDLAAIGYDAEWDCVPAVFVGAPHIRNRVWIVAYPQVGGCGSQRQDDATEARADAPPGRAGQQSSVLADANGGRLEECTQLDSHQEQDPSDRNSCWQHSDRRSDHLADAAGARLPAGSCGASRPAWNRTRRPGPDGLGGHVADAQIFQRETVPPGVSPHRSDWWAAEPRVGRVAHGIPRRVDRLRGLGNAVVPQVAEHIGRLIMAAAMPP